MTRKDLLSKIKTSSIKNVNLVFDNGKTWKIDLLEGEYMAQTVTTLKSLEKLLLGIASDVKVLKNDVKVLKNDVKAIDNRLEKVEKDIFLIKSLPTIQKELNEVK